MCFLRENRMIFGIKIIHDLINIQGKLAERGECNFVESSFL